MSKSYAMFLKDGSGWRQFAILGEDAAAQSIRDGKGGSAVAKDMDTNAVTFLRLSVRKSTVYNGTGRLRPFSNHYAAEGPDGTRFTNSSLATLRDVIARKYNVRKKNLHLEVN